MKAHLILYVRDQLRSSEFYRHVLGIEPNVDEPGMTEFALGQDAVLGLMAEDAIRRLLGPRLPNPARGPRVPRAELYLLVTHPAAHHQRAVDAGAVELSPIERRDWGDEVSYVLDLDSHVVAFAGRKP